jgi:hypothetical protein
VAKGRGFPTGGVGDSGDRSAGSLAAPVSSFLGLWAAENKVQKRGAFFNSEKVTVKTPR